MKYRDLVKLFEAEQLVSGAPQTTPPLLREATSVAS